jgi:error-prone DNA polymerase
VEARPVDINHSFWDNVLERDETGALALRLGFRQAEGIHEAEAKRLVAARRDGFASIEELSTRARLYGRPMRALADADAFRSIGFDRRQALWEVRRLPEDDPLPLFASSAAPELGGEADANLPEMGLGEHVATDYQTMRLSLKAHPMALLRPLFRREGVCSAAEWRGWCWCASDPARAMRFSSRSRMKPVSRIACSGHASSNACAVQ